MKQRAKSRKVTPEAAACRQITDYLTAHGIRYFSNEVYRGPTKSGAWLNVGEQGMADYTAFVPFDLARCLDTCGLSLTPLARKSMRSDLFLLLHIEVKAQRGKQSPIQKAWQEAEETDGRYYIIANGYEPVEAWLKQRGLVNG